MRVRPLTLDTELGHEHIITAQGDKELTVKSELHHELKSTFDSVLLDQSQHQVFTKVVQPVLPHFLNGYNCTVFTYG